MKSYYMGIDIGGSHISAALINPITKSVLENSIYRQKINPHACVNEIIKCWQSLICRIFDTYGQSSILGIGVAIPGPFDYKRGISGISGVGKYDTLFGLNIKQILRHIFPDEKKPILFLNDATAYALGEYYAGARGNIRKSIFISLGTGFGSAFLMNGIPQLSGNGVPENGYLYDYPVAESIADDQLTTRWFIRMWQEKTGRQITGVKELAEEARKNNKQALEIFDCFVTNLAELMGYWIQQFHPDSLVIGGNIAKAHNFFLDSFISKIRKHTLNNVEIKVARLGENAPIIGAALFTSQAINNMNIEKRKTTQFLISETISPTAPGKYNIYPGFPLGEDKIKSGDGKLAAWIMQHKIVTIDGYVGVLWDDFVKNIDKEIVKAGKKARWYHADIALRAPEDIDKMVEPYLGDKESIFGKITDKQLIDWFDEDKLSNIKPDADADINILVGCGASLCRWQGTLIYIDLPKNELQYRARAVYITNLGTDKPDSNSQMYKRFYFIDWPVLNNHKREILPQIDLIIDGQRSDNYSFMSGDDLRKGLSAMAHNFFRARPWFEPGVWGGTWMKNHIEGLTKDVDNLAWSYELMVLENGLLFESDNKVLEVSFDFLMYNSYKEVLGDCADRFEYSFPIRFDFLDTFDGGNLSVQCHPGNQYIKDNFGMPFTQDETYYILDCKDDAKVYLGFQKDIDPHEFYQTLTESRSKNTEVDIPKYIQVFPAKKHDLFLIPNGTVHASGKNNLVLEVSSAPYIFTFKMYDWLRLDMDGKPRPINIRHAMNNLHFDRQGDVVKNELISKPYVLEKTNTYVLEHVPTHKEHFYDIHRYTFNHEIRMKTDNKCHVWILVEGCAISLKIQNGMTSDFSYAETFVVPASAGNYTITNKSDKPAVMLQSFVK